ncbi:MAG TPA: translocation/assembly module TamB domain-containing protein [Terriglobales bacterium]|nr:translocation/assembly module TamB domain-containing protein [Terriglobales bacterium]
MTEPLPEHSPEQSTESSAKQSTESSPPERRRILWKLFLLFCVFSLVGFSLLGWYVTTDSFQRMVRRRVIAAAEKLTGGRVELGELHTIPFRLRVDARDLTIHGREAPDQAPFLRVDRLQAELKIISLLSTTVGLHSLVLEHPVVHIIDYPDGTTNAPVPQASLSVRQGPVEQLISLAVSHLEVQQGELLWQDKKVPFEFAARDLALLLNYSLLRRQYEAHVVAGSVATRVQDYPSFVWRADASLVLARGRADIVSLTVASGKSEIHLAGRLLDFHNPQVNGDYHGVADLGELASVTRQVQVRKGTAQFEGKGSWSLQNFATQGTVQAKDIEWSNGKLSMRNGRIAAGFSVTPDRFHVSAIKANLLGGDLTGDADVTNWQSSLPNPPEPSSAAGRRHGIGRIPPGSLQRGSVRLQLAGFPLLPALEMLSSQKLPLDRLALSGNASGNVEVLWVGSIRDAEARLNLGIAPPLNPAPSEIPVRGKIDGIYLGSRDELEVTQLKLTTPASEITATGNLAATSSLQFSFTSHNLREWTPLLEAAYGYRELPLTVHGWASLAGNASGKLSEISVNGNLEVYDFDTILPATQGISSRTIHWDALATAVQYSSNHFAAHNGSIIHGHTTAHFETSAELTGGILLEGGPFTLHFDLRNANVAELAKIAGLTQPFAGTLDLSATVSGTRYDPHGDGHLELHNGMAYGVIVPLVKSDLRLAGGELQFNNIDASVYGAPISGSAAVSTSIVGTSNGGTSTNESSKNAFRLNLFGRNLDLARFPRLQTSRFSADGVADFTLRASGTPELPSIEAHVHLKDLAMDKERVGDFYVDAVTEGRLLDLKAHSDFDKADLTIAGTVALEHDFNADLNLAFHHLDADSLLRIYLPGKITGHSSSEGTLQVRGPLRTPRELKAVAELQSFSVEVDRVQVQSVGAVRFEVADQALLVESLHLTGSGTDFTVHGRAHLSGAQELDLRLDGSVNMALFQSLYPKILARGTVGVSLNAGGTLAQPVLQGRLEVKNTFVSHNDFPSGLSDLNGVLLFDRNRFQIESLSGATGGGAVALTGSATYQSGVLQLDFGATAHGVRLRYPPGVSSTADADLRLTGSTNSALLSGNVVVTKLAVTPGFDFSAYIEKSRQGIVLTQTDSLQSRLKLDVHVTTTPELQMQTAIARLSGNADLRVRGTAERPAILGRAEVLEGEISFNGTKYKLERGDVTFANPARTQPIIDLQATTRVRDYDITVQFRGDASVANGLKVTWQSEPQLPEGDVIALLALGRTREESAAAASSGSSFGFGGDASNLLINQALNSTVNSRLQRLFGASRVKVDPQGLASETNVVRGPQVTVEQQVASNITLTYSTNVSVSNQQIIQVEYNITRTISIVALRDQNGVVSFVLKLRRRRK